MSRSSTTFMSVPKVTVAMIKEFTIHEANAIRVHGWGAVTVPYRSQELLTTSESFGDLFAQLPRMYTNPDLVDHIRQVFDREFIIVDKHSLDLIVAEWLDRIISKLRFNLSTNDTFALRKSSIEHLTFLTSRQPDKLLSQSCSMGDCGDAVFYKLLHIQSTFDWHNNYLVVGHSSLP